MYGNYNDGATEKVCTVNMQYSDLLFDKNANLLTDSAKGELAKLSMLASAAVYQKKYAEEFMNSCGFKEEQYDYQSTGDNFVERNDNVSYIVGFKKFEDYTLVAVWIKGTSKDYEWISNFNIGDGDYHIGFSKAEVKLRYLIQSFITSNNIKGKIKFWVTGHSRGAAIANLYSKYLTDKYGVKNVFAFTFATPRVSKNVSKDSKKIYPNIRNYLNEGDFVTELAPESWGYNRYGEDISLDSKYKSKMKSIFYKDTQIKYEGYNKNEKNDLIRLFVDYAGKSTKDYYKRKIVYSSKGILIAPAPAQFAKRSLAKLLIVGDLNRLVTEKDLQGSIPYSFYTFNNDPMALALVTRMWSDRTKIAHAHTQATYLAWLKAKYPRKNLKVLVEKKVNYIELSPGSYSIKVNFANANDECKIYGEDAKISIEDRYMEYPRVRMSEQYAVSDGEEKNFQYRFYNNDNDSIHDELKIDLYSGKVRLYQSKNGTNPQKLYIIKKLEHPILWNITLKEGETITFNNKNYNGDIIAYPVMIKGIVDDDKDVHVEESDTDYWWNKYIGFDVSVNNDKISSSFWTIIKSCHKIQYKVVSGEISFYILYNDAQTLSIEN